MHYIEYFLLLYNTLLYMTFCSLQVTLSVGLAKLVGNLQMLTFYVVWYRLHVILIVWNFFFFFWRRIAFEYKYMSTNINKCLSRSLQALVNAMERQSHMWTVEQIYFQSRCHCKLLFISSYEFYSIGSKWIVYIFVILLHVKYCVQLFTLIWFYIFIIILHMMVNIFIIVQVAAVHAMKCSLRL